MGVEADELVAGEEETGRGSKELFAWAEELGPVFEDIARGAGNTL